MDSEIISLLKDKIDKVDSKVDKIGEKVDQLLKFKWEIVGGSVVISAIISITIQILIMIWGKS